MLTSVTELTPEWLTAALGAPVHDVRHERVGTGQIGTCHRLHLTGDGVPERLLAKLPAEDPATRDLLAGTYRGEVRFYSELAPTLDVRVPRTWYAAAADDSGAFALIMEDLHPYVQGDQIAGCTVDQARDAVVNLAGLHGPRWCDPALRELGWVTASGPEDAAMLAELYGPTTEAFVEGLGDLLSPEDVETLRACVPVCERWSLARGERFGLVHGDYRLDNMMFPPDGGPGVIALDWQTLTLALPARDLAYFVATSLTTQDRRAAERDLVAAYHAALASYGVSGYPLEQCWDDYVFGLLQGPLVATFGCAYGARTERGDRMFAAMVARSCAAIRDHDTLAMV